MASKPAIFITVTLRKATPTADTFVAQVREALKALSGDDQLKAWRLKSISMASPLTIHAFNESSYSHISAGVSRIDEAFDRLKDGHRIIASRFPPLYAEQAEAIRDYLNNGASSMEIRFGRQKTAHVLTFDRVSRVVDAIVREQVASRHSATGDVEGMLDRVEVKADGTRVFYVRDRLTRVAIECRCADVRLFDSAKTALPSRVLVSGTIHYRATGAISRVDATGIKGLPSEIIRLADMKPINVGGNDPLGWARSLRRG